MFAMFPLALGLCGVLSVLALVTLAGSMPRLEDPAARPWARRARLRCWMAVLAAVLVGLLTAGIGVLVPSISGLSTAILPGVATTAGLLAYAAVPYVRPVHLGPVAASLTPRRTFADVRGIDRWLPVALAFLTVGALTWTGATSAPDEAGNYTQATLTTGSMTASHGPYPGWFYGLPLMAVTIALLVAMAVALARVSTAPAPPVAVLFEADRRLRRAAVLIITRLTTATLLADLGCILVLAGLAQRALVKTAEINGLDVDGLRLALSWVLLVTGCGALAAAVVFAGLAVAGALRLPIRFADQQRVAA